MRKSGHSRANLRSLMNWLLCFAAFSITLGFASVTSAEDDVSCGDQPPAPTLPEEASRTEYTLSAARDDFIEYQKQNELYLNCLMTLMGILQHDIEGMAGASAENERNNKKRKYAITGMSYNKAVDAEKTAALSFNSAFKRFQKDS